MINRKYKFRFVEIKHDKGCAIACLAMVLGFDYDWIEKQFYNDFDKAGITAKQIKDYLAVNGVDVIAKRSFGHTNIRLEKERLAKPFADIHIVCVKPCADAKNNHALIMDKKGKFIDPAFSKGTKRFFYNYYEIEEVIGCFRVRAKDVEPKR